MQLTFEHTQSLGAGTQPQAIHTPENIVQVLFTRPDSQGRIYAMDASTPMGAWASRTFGTPYLICTDIAVEFLKLKYVSASSIFVVWKNATEEGEVVPYQEGVTHSLRHRLAVWAVRQNLSKFLESGTIELRDDDPVTRISAEFGNVNQYVSDEIDSIVAPGSQLILFFRSGDSDPYEMGKYFVDKNQMGVTDSTTSVSGRNNIGKILKDQTFDEATEYPLANLKTQLEAICDYAGLDATTRVIYPSVNDVGMRFPPDLALLGGITEMLKTAAKWTIRERADGKIVLGPDWWTEFDQPQTYIFHRNTDVFSREIVRDDMEAYGRVCVHYPAYSEGGVDYPAVYKYHAVDPRFPVPAKKTLYVEIAQGTAALAMEEYAAELAAMLSYVGVIETFVGPFRPQLWPGDSAHIIAGPASKLVGGITTVRHTFGKRGYFTEFTVDSGSNQGRVRISDYIAKISGRQTSSGQVKRLYS